MKLLAVLVAAFTLITAMPGAARAEPTPTRVERNSTAMMITGIGLGSVGIIAVGVGTALMIRANDVCAEDATSATGNLPLAERAAAYNLADAHCHARSPGTNFGFAAVVGGSVFAAAGVAFTIAGAWKVTVPGAPSMAPVVRLGPGTITLGAAF